MAQFKYGTQLVVVSIVNRYPGSPISTTQRFYYWHRPRQILMRLPFSKALSIRWWQRENPI